MSRIFYFLLLLSPHLVSAQEYKRIHRKAIVIDTHNDVLSSVIMKGMHIENDLTGKTHTDISRIKSGGIDVQVFSVFCDERYGPGKANAYANTQIDSLLAIVQRNNTEMMMVTDPGELRSSVKKKKIGCMIGVEGGHMIEDRLGYLEILYQRGARYMTLTWNNSTSWATSAWDETLKKDSLPHPGLTEFGKQVVRRMNELGMMIDVSHVGEQTFRDIISTTTRPIIASHSDAYSLSPVPRNLKDDQIIAIGRNKGVIHLNFYSGFVDSNYNKRKNLFFQRHQAEVDSLKAMKLASYEIDEWMSKKYVNEADSLRPALSQLLDHLDHIVRLIGVDHVGLGSDFDGIDSSPKTLDDVSDLSLITEALIERGYNKRAIKKILGKNFIRVFKANQKGKS